VAHETIRHELLAELEDGPLSAHEISGRIRISEKDVYEHLEHIRTTLQHTGRRLAIQPAECKKCGFVFSKRERLTKPGKCPVCRSESIHRPLFSIKEEK
jgi:transcriptional regulator